MFRMFWFLGVGTMFLYASQQPEVMRPCVKELFVPQYSVLARNAGSTGIATATLGFSHVSSTPDVRVAGVSADLQAMVTAAVKRSIFNDSCAGRELVLTFRFELDVGSGTLLRPLISFSPPATFTIRIRPGKMDVERPVEDP